MYGYRKGRMYYIAGGIVGVPIGKQTRRYVYRHDFGTAVIDVSHYRLESSRQWVVEPGAEKTVDYEPVAVDVGHIEALGDFDQHRRGAHRLECLLVVYALL